MADGFQVARLIPTSGISNQAEAETRATSALLAVLSIVRDLSSSLLGPLGASTARKATVNTFIETKFKLADGTLVRPDGLIQVTYGSNTWKAFVEVKTGDNPLEAAQINNYLQLAREQGIDAVLTISNEIAAGSQHPCEGVKLRANSKVRLAHYSWTEILSHAVRGKVHRGVDDPEQAWILGELIRYLEHPASGAMSFSDMGAHWVAVRDAAREGTLRRNDDAAREVVGRWDQLLRYAALRLGSDTGVEVQHVVPKAHADPKVRIGHLLDSLTSSGTLDGVIRVPGAAGNLTVQTDLRARRVSVSADVIAPTDRGAKARITWLVRQLGPDTPSATIVEAWGRSARQPIVATVAELRENRDLLVDPDKRELLRFRLTQRGEMGQARKDGGRSPGFIESVTDLVNAFYVTTVQQILPWTARAPQAAPRPKQPDVVDQPIEDADQLDDAIEAARSIAAEESFADRAEQDSDDHHLDHDDDRVREDNDDLDAGSTNGPEAVREDVDLVEAVPPSTPPAEFRRDDDRS